MQANINGIQQWAKEWKMCLNADKTQVMVISSSRKETNWIPDLHLEERKLEVVKEYKFLGVIIDNELRFASHVKKVISKAQNRNKILRCLAGKKWGQSLESQRSLYCTYIRSAMEYAGPSWYPWISDTAKKSLERVQNTSLQIMTRMAQKTPVEFLQLQAGIEPFKLRMEKNNQIMYERYMRLKPDDSRRVLATKEVKKRLKSRIGWRKETEQVMTGDYNRETPRTIITPMMKCKVEIANVELSRKKEEYNASQLASITEMKIADINADIEIYTDGSTSGQQRNGGAGIYVQDRTGNQIYEKSTAAGEFCSSYDGECVAMNIAIDWINEQPLEEKKFAIFTDSKSLVESIQNDNWKDTHEWLRMIKAKLSAMQQNLTICWVPSHCNVFGNEKADLLAEKGTELSQKDAPTTFGIIKAKIKNIKWKIDHQRAKDTFQERRKPKSIENSWPAEVRRVYGRVRSGHAKELRHYRKRIGMDTDATCIFCELDEDETIEHLVCRCTQLEARRMALGGDFNVGTLTSDPEKCRKLLMSRIEKLNYRKEVEDEGGGSLATRGF